MHLIVYQRLQQSQQHRLKFLQTFANGTRPRLAQLTLLSMFKQIIKEDSFFGLWKGTWPTIMRTVPGSALYFMVLEQLRSYLSDIRFKRKVADIEIGKRNNHISPNSGSDWVDVPYFTPGAVNLLAGGIGRVVRGLLLFF